MKTPIKNPDRIRHIYRQTQPLKSYTVYQCMRVENNRPNKFTERIRIEKFQGYSNAKNITHYLRIRDKPNWQKCTQITGLRSFKGAFYGDDNRKEKKSFLVIFIKDDFLILDYFNSFNPFTPVLRKQLVNQTIKEVKKALPEIESTFTDLKTQQLSLDLFRKDSKINDTDNNYHDRFY